ncbi:MAG: hypothetical protein LBL96_03735 [Clostridiales bacterium]|jgi:L-alanine-DL-glutamate epimerase-like enolase superfamily enzyme|nr:hypothetical protein [Clostridiales bacterium]
MIIQNTSLGFEPQKLKHAFGFKGNYLTELWQTAVLLDDGEYQAIGLGTQSVLWSDGSVFDQYGEDKGNRLMLSVSRYALDLLKGNMVCEPYQMLQGIFDAVYAYAKQIAKNLHLKRTFVLNALVPIDNALWLLYAKQRKIKSFGNILNGEENKGLLNIPLISYATEAEEIKSLLTGGAGLIKIKIGSDPGKDNNLLKMLKWDKERLKEIHQIASGYTTPYTIDNKIRYYLDANGRYPNKAILQSFLEYADEIGALKQIVLFEEPFPEECLIDVKDIPVTVAMDESAHSIEDLENRIRLGYKAVALKPIAKTLSYSLKMLEIAKKHDISCFCADLTVNPNLVAWNQNVAARLAPLQGMRIGAFESNGAQNYENWDDMKAYSSCYHEPMQGVYLLDKEFYAKSGGIFDVSQHYVDVARRGIEKNNKGVI